MDTFRDNHSLSFEEVKEDGNELGGDDDMSARDGTIGSMSEFKVNSTLLPFKETNVDDNTNNKSDNNHNTHKHITGEFSYFLYNPKQLLLAIKSLYDIKNDKIKNTKSSIWSSLCSCSTAPSSDPKLTYTDMHTIANSLKHYNTDSTHIYTIKEFMQLLDGANITDKGHNSDPSTTATIHYNEIYNTLNRNYLNDIRKYIHVDVYNSIYNKTIVDNIYTNNHIPFQYLFDLLPKPLFTTHTNNSHYTNNNTTNNKHTSSTNNNYNTNTNIYHNNISTDTAHALNTIYNEAKTLFLGHWNSTQYKQKYKIYPLLIIYIQFIIYYSIQYKYESIRIIKILHILLYIIKQYILLVDNSNGDEKAIDSGTGTLSKLGHYLTTIFPTLLSHVMSHTYLSPTPTNNT